jgi:hypothetical protein
LSFGAHWVSNDFTAVRESPVFISRWQIKFCRRVLQPDYLVSMTTQETVLLAYVFVRVDSDKLGGTRCEGRDNTIARCYHALLQAAVMRESFNPEFKRNVWLRHYNLML